MIPRHAARFSDLQPAQATRLARTLGFLDPTDEEPVSGTTLYEMCTAAGTSHAEVILCLSSSPDPEAVLIVETLMGRPIDVRRRGESAYDPVTGRLLDPKNGSSRPAGNARSSASRPRVDNRVVVSVAPNPKKPGSASHTRYEAWAVGKTVSQCLTDGLSGADVRHDTEHGHVVLRAGVSE